MSLSHAKSSLHTVRDTKFEESKTSEWDEKDTSLHVRAGWINPAHGYIYQLKVLMLFLHRGLSCKYSFRLGTEIKEAKKFDDLVFEYVENNKKFYRLLQAKHKFHECKKITVDKLLTDTSGDYSLVKYFYSFQVCKKDNFFKDGVIKDVIICTNIDFDMDDLKKSGIEIEKVEEKDDILDIKSNKKESTRYKFTKSMIKQLKTRLKPEDSENDIEHFLKHLIFAVNQPNEEELGQIIKKEIGKEIGFLDTENAYNALLMKIMDLSLGKRNSMFLSHEEGKKFIDGLKRDIPVWFNIQDPIPSFTGRYEKLKQMHEAVNNSCVCISGMGGVGKTELVRKYIAVHGHEYKNQVVWINAESYRNAADCFRQLASDKLNISFNNSDGKEKHISCIVSDVYQFFSKGRSLFIFDNAEKYKCKHAFDCGINQFLPRLPDNCVKPNIIITSRNQKWPESIKTIVLEVFEVEEGKEFVEKVLTFEDDEEKKSISELCKKLQFLPLALQQAVAYIKMQNEQQADIKPNFGINNYLERYSIKTHEMLDFNFFEDSDSNYDKSVFVSWSMAFDKISEKENGTDALTILQIISYYLPENIPITLLSSFFNDEEKFISVMGLLKQYSLINRQYKTVSVHRLVQQVTRIKLQKQNNEVEILKHCVALLLCNSNLNFETIDHAISVWTFASKHNQILTAYLVLSADIIMELRHCGRIEEAIRISNEALLIASPHGDLYTQNSIQPIKHNLALCILDKGDYVTALEILQEVHEFQKTTLEPTHSDALTTKNNIVHALCKLGRSRDALKYCKEVFEICTVNFDETHPAVLSANNSLSGILIEEERYEEALSLLQENYQVQKKTYGDRHEGTCAAMNNIAVVLKSYLNKSEESLEILERVCNIQESILPKNHPELLHTKYNIAGTLGAKGNFDSALKLYEEILYFKKETLGEHDPELIDISVRIADTLKLQGNYEKALEILNNAFNKQHITSGPTHLGIFQIRTAIADVFTRQKKYTDALDVYNDLLDEQTANLGDIHPLTLKTRESMGSIFLEQEKYDAVLACGLEVLYYVKKSFGRNHPSTIKYKTTVAGMHLIKKNFKKALYIFTQVLKFQEYTLGKDHIDCQETRTCIAKALTDQVQYDENIIVLKQWLKAEDTDINEKLENGLTMLHRALNNVDERAVELILQHGAEIFVTSDEGDTPLHVAVLQGQLTFVKMLLQRMKPERLKDSIDAKTISSGSTALHIAVERSHFDIVKYLLKSHATFCAKNKNGKTPLDLAIDSIIIRFFKMIHELFDGMKKADVSDIVQKLKTLSTDEFLAVTNTCNDQGFTLVQMAITNNQKQIASQVLQMVQKSKSK